MTCDVRFLGSTSIHCAAMEVEGTTARGESDNLVLKHATKVFVTAVGSEYETFVGAEGAATTVASVVA